jgi:hypothetical protein
MAAKGAQKLVFRSLDEHVASGNFDAQGEPACHRHAALMSGTSDSEQPTSTQRNNNIRRGNMK